MNTIVYTATPGTEANPSGIGLLRVCAWCLRKNSVFAILPQLQSLDLSVGHGICEFHRRQQQERIERMATPLPEPEATA